MDKFPNDLLHSEIKQTIIKLVWPQPSNQTLAQVLGYETVKQFVERHSYVCVLESREMEERLNKLEKIMVEWFNAIEVR